MNSDEFVRSLVKSALEDGATLSEQRLQAVLFAASREARRRRVRRLAMRWGASALLAASVAVIAALWARVPTMATGDESRLAEAIGLLREMDGGVGEVQPGATVGEQLLAWQEAPCADLLFADELL